MKELYYIFHGYGGENSLIPLADYMKEKGHPVLVIDDQKFPYTRLEMFERLKSLKKQYRIVFVTSAHLWFDQYNYLHFYGHDPNMISALELLDYLKPDYSVFYPHDMECFMHDSELPWLGLFDLVMLPYQHNIYYKLKHICKRVEVVYWIKKHTATELHVDHSNPEYTPAFFPSNIITFYDQLGAEGYADWFRRYIGPEISIKMPAGDFGVYPILSKEGYCFLDPASSVYDTMSDHNLIIGSGHSSIIYEAAFSGIPVISILDGCFTDEIYLKSISGINGVYPLHPEELQDFLKEINSNHKLLATGPDILKPFDFNRVYQYLTEF